MRYDRAAVLRRGRYAATCSEGFCRGETAEGTSGLERGIFDNLNFVLGGGRHDVVIPMDRRMRTDMLFRLKCGFVLAIEYDGAFWHQGQLDRDVRKTHLLRRMGIDSVMRIRESPLQLTTRIDVQVPQKSSAQLCASLSLLHLSHTLALRRFDCDTWLRINNAFFVAADPPTKKQVHCVDCQKTLRNLDRDRSSGTKRR
jgi:hypothetical protein